MMQPGTALKYDKEKPHSELKNRYRDNLSPISHPRPNTVSFVSQTGMHDEKSHFPGNISVSFPQIQKRPESYTPTRILFNLNESGQDFHNADLESDFQDFELSLFESPLFASTIEDTDALEELSFFFPYSEFAHQSAQKIQRAWR